MQIACTRRARQNTQMAGKASMGHHHHHHDDNGPSLTRSIIANRPTVHPTHAPFISLFV